jgi:hypothetical protein
MQRNIPPICLFLLLCAFAGLAMGSVIQFDFSASIGSPVLTLIISTNETSVSAGFNPIIPGYGEVQFDFEVVLASTPAGGARLGVWTDDIGINEHAFMIRFGRFIDGVLCLTAEKWLNSCNAHVTHAGILCSTHNLYPGVSCEEVEGIRAMCV